ncbi:MAG: hypothetical protein Q9219_006483 [cf. Caloplaca sp. 3 TL-2023]
MELATRPANPTFDIGHILKQDKLTTLSIVIDPSWSFAWFTDRMHLPITPLRLKYLSLVELKSHNQESPKFRSLLAFLDLDFLAQLVIQEYWLIKLVLQDINGKVPGLKALRLNGAAYNSTESSVLMQSQFDALTQFLTTAAPVEISLRNFDIEVWPDLIQYFQPKLRQLSIQALHKNWEAMGVPHSEGLGQFGRAEARFILPRKQLQSIEPEELMEINAKCPYIEHLGMDIGGTTAGEIHYPSLRNLELFHRLRHLHLVVHDRVEENSPPRSLWGGGDEQNSPTNLSIWSSAGILSSLEEQNNPRPLSLSKARNTPASRAKQITHENIVSKLTPGSKIVELFFHLHDRKRGLELETLLYHRSLTGEDCMLWHLGGRRTLLSYRDGGGDWFSGPPTEVRELYEGTTLAKMYKRPLEKGTEWATWTPAYGIPYL